MSRYEHLLVTRADGVGTVTINRPDKLNAFAGRMRQDMGDALRELVSDDQVRVIVITGAGRAFCAGADISYMKQLLETKDWENAADLVEAGRTVVTTIRETSKPVIASVNGPAAGGGANLALACDLRIASDQASIGQTFNRIGLAPDWGGTYFLPRLVGPSKALELFFSADMVDAREAHRIGLFNQVVPHHQLEAETRALAQGLAAKAPLALALAKQAVYRSGDRSLGEMLDFELEAQMQCFQSGDAWEGLQAFLDKRRPTFHGT
ncbi:MAG TPA: enoyl-CoA hydratase-related protein [Gemmatimonadales bacterium]